MTAPVEITSYQPPFRERLVALWRASFAHGVGAPVPNPLEDHLRYFDDIVLTETTVHLALRNGELVGFGAFTPEAVMQLYVDVAHLGQGIGSRLLDLAKAGSGGKLWLYTFATNTRAQRFYERHGFEPVQWISYVNGGSGIVAGMTNSLLRLRPQLAEGVGVLARPVAQ